MAMCGAGHCYRHRSCFHQPAGARPGMRRGCTIHTGQDYPRQLTLTMSVKCCKYKKAAQICVCVRAKGNAHIIKFLATDGNCDSNPDDNYELN